MEKKQTKLEINEGFKITSSSKSNDGQVCITTRSQCRTTHKRKDC